MLGRPEPIANPPQGIDPAGLCAAAQVPITPPSRLRMTTLAERGRPLVPTDGFAGEQTPVGGRSAMAVGQPSTLAAAAWMATFRTERKDMGFSFSRGLFCEKEFR